jgi:hypothetical protein
MTNYFIEWNKTEKGNIIANSLTTFYNNTTPANLISYQIGFVQEQRYNLCGDCVDGTFLSTSSFPPNIFSNTLSYTPLYTCNFEEGKFFYPIITNDFLIGSQNYSYYLQLYKYYLDVSVCQKMFYYISTYYILIDPNSKTEYDLILFYRHDVNPCNAPIHYKWSLTRILYSVSSNSYTKVEALFCGINTLITSLFTTLDQQSTCQLIPKPLQFHFLTHYIYRFGSNYGLNGSIPSNNGLVDTCQNQCESDCTSSHRSS